MAARTKDRVVTQSGACVGAFTRGTPDTGA